jgi:hypothetical protein
MSERAAAAADPAVPMAVSDEMIERGLTALAARGWRWDDEAEEMRADVRAVLEAGLAGPDTGQAAHVREEPNP